MVHIKTILTYLRKKILRPQLVTGIRKKPLSQDLFEIGHFDPPKLVSNYTAGQMFVHKVFGYRGLILFPWITRIYDRELYKSGNISNLIESSYKSTYYYQVLIDSRDVEFTRIKNEPAPVIRLQKGLHGIPGVDYVCQDDILPYTVTRKEKFQHALVDHFFHYHPDKDICYEAKEELKSWQEKNSSRLELTDVHTEITENIKVTVMPFFIGLRRTRRYVIFLWRYSVRLENLDSEAVKVRKHNWKIFSLLGSCETKSGSGVAGLEPVLDKSQPAFQYSSHVSLYSPCGHMIGALEMERKNGTLFLCRVPQFMLQSVEEKC